MIWKRPPTEREFRDAVSRYLAEQPESTLSKSLAVQIVEWIGYFLPRAIIGMHLPDHLFESFKPSRGILSLSPESDEEIKELSHLLFVHFSKTKSHMGKLETAFECFLNREMPLIKYLFYYRFGQEKPAFYKILVDHIWKGKQQDRLLYFRHNVSACLRVLLKSGTVTKCVEGRTELYSLPNWSNEMDPPCGDVTGSELRSTPLNFDVEELDWKSVIVKILKAVGHPLSRSQISLMISVCKGSIAEAAPQSLEDMMIDDDIPSLKASHTLQNFGGLDVDAKRYLESLKPKEIGALRSGAAKSLFWRGNPERKRTKPERDQLQKLSYALEGYDESEQLLFLKVLREKLGLIPVKKSLKES